jgi:ribosomal protein S18 acetylase RimI-like enzyme
MSGPVTVRPFAPDDWQVLRELRLRALELDPEAFGSTYAREAAFPESTWRERAAVMALATRDGTPAGIVGARVVEPTAVELIAMWVAPEHRGHGVGDALTAWVIDRARRERRAAVKLWFARGNEAARRLYERGGFVEVEDDTPLEERFDRHDHRMVRPLRNLQPTTTAVDEAVIPVLRVENAARAVAWYARLGFVKQWEHQFEPGFPWFVCVARGSTRLYLSEHEGDARPDTLLHLNVVDVDAVAAEFGATVDEEGLAGRQVNLVDSEGNRLRIATPR